MILAARYREYVDGGFTPPPPEFFLCLRLGLPFISATRKVPKSRKKVYISGEVLKIKMSMKIKSQKVEKKGEKSQKVGQNLKSRIKKDLYALRLVLAHKQMAVLLELIS